MMRSDLRYDVCKACGTPLSDAVSFERREVVWSSGEFKGEPGVALEIVCTCGTLATLPWVANPRPVT